MRLWAFLLLVLTIVAASFAVLWYALPWRPALATPSFMQDRRTAYERWARKRFYRQWPDQKPLNWRVAAKAEEFHQSQPMGRFVLHENDCSDFVDAVVDDALGAKARFRRGSERHMLMRRKHLWDVFYWSWARPLLPGDIVSVAHSPHYAPYSDAIHHVGVIGTDGKVYDWSRIRGWNSDRYGCHSVEWFTRYSHSRKGVTVWRLKAEYRYRVRALPVPAQPAGEADH
jgi:hypothetical protein